MKVINLVLSIVIFLLAVASAVVSFILFGKRTQQAEGWEKMTAAIHQSAVQLDRVNGTAEAKNVTVEELAFENIDNLEQKISGYNGQVSKMVKNHNALVDLRDDSADSFSRIAARVGQNIPAAEFKGEESKENVKKVDSAVRNLESAIKRQPGFRNVSLAGTPKKIGEVVSDLNRTKGKLNAETSRANKAEARAASAERNIKRANDRVAAANAKAKKDVANAKAAAKRQIDAANAAAKRQIAAANAKTAKVADELMRYKNQIGVPADFVPWKDGSKEARENIKAQVTKVAGDYGYIVVNIGSSTKVLQYTGVNEKNNPAKPLTVAVKPLIKKGFKFNVYRKGIAGEAELVAMIVLDQVGSHESIANIPVDAEIKVGDYLMFAAEK